MSTTVYKYQIYCDTEQEWKYVWGEEGEAPSACPVDTAHTVNSNSVSIIREVSSNDVIAHQPADGYFMVEGFPLNVPAGNIGDISEHEVSFDIPIEMWTVVFHATGSMLGDRLDVIINPNTPVGGLTALGNIGDTVLNVTSTVTDNVVAGMFLTLTDNGSPPTIQNVGLILSVDKTGGTVTIKNALTSTFAPGALVLLNVYMAKSITIDAEDEFKFGLKGFSAKHVPSGTKFRMYYENNSGLEKQINWDVGYYYGN